MIITGIGSRETPALVLAEMQQIGIWCHGHGIWVRSGHAQGADYAFEAGAQESCITYEPWRNFNDGKLERTRAQVCIPEDQEWMRELVRLFHPAPDKLSEGAMKLMMRNGCQLFGRKGPDMPVNTHSQAVVCWTSDGEDVGGTSQALRIARAYQIPILNMGLHEWNAASKVIAYLENMLAHS